jgi:flagellar basal-body rod protein FlgC
MAGLVTSMAHAAAGMEAQAARLRHTAENIANADTPGYRRKTVVFDHAREDGRVTLGPVRLDPAALRTIHDPGHPLADAAGNYEGSNVDLVIELADAREAQRSYEANLRTFDQARQMAQSLFDLIRR